VYTITVKNTPGVALPQTGGEGSLLFSVIGTIFMLTATMGLLGRRKRIAAYSPRH
jgi:LPXTG-motif cell wall-anchored protein